MEEQQVYLTLLERWVRHARTFICNIPDRPGLACYGSGENGWGVQTNQKAFAALAVLAMAEGYEADRTGSSRTELRELALGLLRYSLESHIEGSYHCTDGASWGHTWISALGIERMMHGVDAIAEWMTEADKRLLRKVLISECEWLLDHYEVVGGLYAKDDCNKPESNLWNGALLHRTAAMYPDWSRAEQGREKGIVFLINSISVPADEWDETIKDGKMVSKRFVGANFFESMALNHHGYLNVGYMVICLSNIAMLHFSYKKSGFKAPEALYHHMEDLWRVVKLCTFSDGRLLRIGGDTRMRYTYCQDYVIPVWHMIKDLLNDPDCDRFERGWLKQIQTEMNDNEDDSFLSSRGDALLQNSPLYYTRLESDRAVALSMGLAWMSRSVSGEMNAAEQEERGALWHDAAHGAYLHRSKNRIASWVWDAAEKPQGLCLPAQGSDMAEWRENLSVRLSGLGRITEQSLECHDGCAFEGGFLTWGSTLIHTRGLLAEGQSDHDIARSQLVCAALPDNRHMIVLQHAKASGRRIYLRSVKGLHLLIPNDVFNGYKRIYSCKKGKLRIQGADGGTRRQQELVQTASNWLNVDDKLGVIAAYGADQLLINRPGRRQIGLRETLANSGLEGMHYADEICAPCKLGMHAVDAGQVIADTGFILQADVDSVTTSAYASREGTSFSAIVGDNLADSGASSAIRAVKICGADDKTYLLVANFGNEESIWRFNPVELGMIKPCTALPSGDDAGFEPSAVQALDVAAGKPIQADSAGNLPLTIQPGAARLVQL